MSLNKERVVHIRLTTGEEVIGEWVQTNFSGGIYAEDLGNGSITLKNPYIVVPQNAGEGQVRIGMAPWVFYFRDKDYEVTIRESAIVFAIPAVDHLANKLAEIQSPLDLSASTAKGIPGFGLQGR